MADDKGSTGEPEKREPIPPRMKDSRQDRLKSALRANLKRRKMQARERGKKNDMPSSDHRGNDEASPDGELGKRRD